MTCVLTARPKICLTNDDPRLMLMLCYIGVCGSDKYKSCVPKEEPCEQGWNPGKWYRFKKRTKNRALRDICNELGTSATIVWRFAQLGRSQPSCARNFQFKDWKEDDLVVHKRKKQTELKTEDWASSIEEESFKWNEHSWPQPPLQQNGPNLGQA